MEPLKNNDLNFDEKEIKYIELYKTKKEPRKSFQTFLRNQNKLYVNSMNVIDRKSAILVKLNASVLTLNSRRKFSRSTVQ